MRQDVDFLKVKATEPFELPAQWITMAAVALLALFTLISLGLLMVEVTEHWSLKRAQKQTSKTIVAFQKIARTHPLLASNTPLVKQIETLKTALAEQKSYYVTLTRVALRYGFSNYLETLAAVVPEGLWLDEVTINQSAKTASLHGYMLKPVDVSTFLEALQKIGAFSGTTFKFFSVKAVPDTAVIEFKITNEKAELEG